jgi:hypothetical protein
MNIKVSSFADANTKNDDYAQGYTLISLKNKNAGSVPKFEFLFSE